MEHCIFEALLIYLGKYGPFTREDTEEIKNAARLIIAKKKNVLTCSYPESNMLVIEGCLHYLLVSKWSGEHTLELAAKHDWLRIRKNTTESPVANNRVIMAVEDSIVIQWPMAEYDRLVTNIPAFADMHIKVLEEYLKTQELRISILTNRLAEDRYETIMRYRPRFAEQFPLNILSNYLGLSREALSRARRSSMKKRNK